MQNFSPRLDVPLAIGTQIVVKRDGQGVIASVVGEPINCMGELSYSVQYRIDNAVSRVPADRIVFVHP